MTFETAVFAVFSEDLREEKSETFTLVGVIPDNVNFVAPGSILPKLGVFVRINFDPDTVLKKAETTLKLSSGAVIKFDDINEALFKQAREEAKRDGNPVAGVVSRVVINGVPLVAGLMRLEVNIDGKDYLAGILNFKGPSATASPPPS
jgi:hypothetical protein